MSVPKKSINAVAAALKSCAIGSLFGVLSMGALSVGVVGVGAITPAAAQSVPLANNIAGDLNAQIQDQDQTASKINFSPLFITLSDAMAAQKLGDNAKAAADLIQIENDLSAQLTPKIRTAPDFNKFSDPVLIGLAAAKAKPTPDNLAQLSRALYAWQKAQNPVDYTQQRRDFAKKVLPAYAQLEAVLRAVNPQDPTTIAAARVAYGRFNVIWTANEKVVRETSKGHYGKVELAMALLRAAIESTPANTAQIRAQSDALKAQLDEFNAGKATDMPELATNGDKPADLSDGILLLEAGLAAFQSGDKTTGSAKLGDFIAMWTAIEGDVSTRDPNLYGRIEAQIPVIMATGQNPARQVELQGLIADLRAINPTAAYTALDSMLILLREGLEALLIVVALLSALKAANQTQGRKWVMGGVIAGLLASVAGAVTLQQLLPGVTAGASREQLEGLIGIIAVMMMIGIGAWLHSKSSVKSWNAFINKQLGSALGAGSFIGLFLLAFLSVLREGAETILFYVGILPNIATTDFVLGIVLALVILAAAAWVMLKTSVKLPIPKLFALLTAVIYALGFKILGVSVSALQLTGFFPRDVIVGVPAVPFVGFYPTWQGAAAQAAYVALIVAMMSHNRTQAKKQQG